MQIHLSKNCTKLLRFYSYSIRLRLDNPFFSKASQEKEKTCSHCEIDNEKIYNPKKNVFDQRVTNTTDLFPL